MIVYDPSGLAWSLTLILAGAAIAGASLYEMRRPSERMRYAPAANWRATVSGLYVVLVGFYHGSQALDAPHRHSPRTALLNQITNYALIVVLVLVVTFLVGRIVERRRIRRLTGQN